MSMDVFERVQTDIVSVLAVRVVEDTLTWQPIELAAGGVACLRSYETTTHTVDDDAALLRRSICMHWQTKARSDGCIVSVSGEAAMLAETDIHARTYYLRAAAA